MITFCIALLFFGASNSLKIWIPNTNIDNNLNWDKTDTPKDCDKVRFISETEIATFWNIKRVIISGLSLPKTGDVILSRNIRIQFRNEEKCAHARELKYIRQQVKGWLDPDNWKSDLEFKWLPHSERVPCAGESILFPPQKTFAIQLPGILVPTGDITFDSQVLEGDTWSDLLQSDLGFQFFKGPDDVRSIPWRKDIGCLNKKMCICGRSSYTIRDRRYKKIDPRIFEEAVCLYAMPKCQPSGCYSAVIPEGHCCGICGAVIKIEDNSKEGLNISSINEKVKEELDKHDNEKKLKSYVGRTRDENIQIVVIAENSRDTVKSHTLANIIKRKLIDQKFQIKLSRVSGLRFSNYLFNNASGAFFGTLVAVLILFASIYYVYVILPNKKYLTVLPSFIILVHNARWSVPVLAQSCRIERLRTAVTENAFMFARFENIENEENLEIGVEPEAKSELPQAFDNPMYSRKIGPEVEDGQISSDELSQLKETDAPLTLESTISKEYCNPVYSELAKTKDLDEYLENLQNDEEEFSENKF